MKIEHHLFTQIFSRYWPIRLEISINVHIDDLLYFREIPLKTEVNTAPFVKIGALRVSEAIKQKFNDFVEVTSDERPESSDVKLHMGIYYHCDDVWNPQVGDIRVQFYYAGLTGEPVSHILLIL